MKIAVINFSGNVGKSTVAKHLLKPRMNNCDIITVESINSDDNGGEKIRGKQFGEMLEVMALMDDVVVDIGASNVEELIQQMKQYRGSHEDFDYYVVPTSAKPKQQRDTINTIDFLSEIGVPAKKIRLLMNMVEPEEIPERLFAGLFEFHKEEKTFTLNPKAVMHANDIYSKLSNGDLTIEGILGDPTDLKEQLKAATDQGEKLRISRLIGVKRLAIGVKEELDDVFKALTK